MGVERSEDRFHVVAFHFRGEGDKTIDERKTYWTRTPVTHAEGCVLLTKLVPREGTRYQLEPTTSTEDSPSGIIYLRGGA